MNCPGKPLSAAFYTTAIAVVLMGYVLSSGPLIWIHQHEAIPAWADYAVDWFYWPLDRFVSVA